MRRESVVAYLLDEDDRTLARAAFEKLRLAGDVRDGGVVRAHEEASSWTVVPDYLILDVSEAEDPLAAIMEVVKASPEGETNLIVVGRHNDVVLYRRMKAAGVAEYMPRPVQAGHLEEVVEAIVRDRRERGKAIEPTRLVAVAGVRGGAGVSTISAGIADALSGEHARKTLLIDTDLEFGVQHILWGAEQSPGMLDMLAEPSRVDAHLFERTVQRARKHLSLLSVNGIRPVPPHIHEDGLKAVILQAHRGIEYVVLDMPCRTPVGRTPLLSAGLVFLVAPPTLPGIHDTIQIVNSLEGAGFAHNLVILVSKIGETRGPSVRAGLFRDKMPFPIIELPFDHKIPQAQFEGKSVLGLKGDFRKAFDHVLSKLPTWKGATPKKSLFGVMMGG